MSHPLVRGLFRCWLLNEAGGWSIFDRVERGIGRLHNGVSWGNGRSGSCLALDGETGYVHLVTHDGRCNAESGFSWSVRLRFRELPNAAGTTPICLDYQRSAGHCWYLRGRTWDNRLDVVFFDSGYSAVIVQGPVVEVGRWYDVTFVFDGYDILLYVDGTLWDVESPGSVLGGQGTSLRIGHVGAYSPEADFEHVMFWNRALSAGEVARLYREPYGMFEQVCHQEVFVHIAGLSGDAGGVAEVAGTTRLVERGPWAGGRLNIERDWLRSALFGPMDSDGLRFGTVLSGGWFWLRRRGCSALYRGGADCVDYDRVLSTGDLDTERMEAPGYSPHNVGQTYCYSVRRFNGLGIPERGCSIARVVIGADGQVQEHESNRVFGLDGVVTAEGKARLRWFYETLGQGDVPVGFNVYGNGGDGAVDFDQVLATVEYEGRRFYEFISGVLDTGSYRFIVRAVTAEGDQSGAAEVRVDVPDVVVQQPEVTGINAR